jgi:hypothetical protein
MMCGEILEELMEFVRHYHRALHSPGVDRRFDELMRAVPPASSESPGPASGTEGIELIFRPYREPFSQASRYAADTEPHLRDPLRFCSADGRYVLREETDPASSRPLFHLTADPETRVEDIELMIDGRTCRTGSEGMLDTEKAGLELTKGSRILIRTNRPT